MKINAVILLVLAFLLVFSSCTGTTSSPSSSTDDESTAPQTNQSTTASEDSDLTTPAGEDSTLPDDTDQPTTDDTTATSPSDTTSVTDTTIPADTTMPAETTASVTTGSQTPNDPPKPSGPVFSNVGAITQLQNTVIIKEPIMNIKVNPLTNTYRNPLITLSTPRVWENYGVGDPFVMRWNGKYYLYCSTKDEKIGIQCWTSDDLVNWSYAGLCAVDPLTKSAYAPEVVYYNGYFYMYTSPAGNGHYVLKSDSPTGPFEVITDNFGHSIDGSVFIDDNGKWYFYSAGENGILAYSMQSPYQVSSAQTNTGAYINGWTEGPMVVKVGGIYYLTYTGNHVWCDGYRIHYATSTASPTVFTAAHNNPILLNTLSAPTGIGHSSTVMGPNMDSYYIVYHACVGVPKREMRIDRLVFNGTTMEVLGPTVSAQQAPEMPDIYSDFTSPSDLANWYSNAAAVTDNALTLRNGGWVLSKHSVGDQYTAECNVASINGGEAGMIFGYTDQNNYGTALFAPDSQKLIVTFVVNGKSTVYEKALVKSFAENTDFSKLQLLTVRKNGEKYTFLVNNRTLCTHQSNLKTGAFGAFSQGGSASFGFMGITGNVDGSSVKTEFKPVSGSLQAITCVEEAIQTVTYNNAATVKLNNGNTLNYLVNVSDTSGYDLVIRYRSSAVTKLKFYQNQKLITTLTLPSTGGQMSNCVFRNLPMQSGACAVTFLAQSGSCEIASFTFHVSEAVPSVNLDFSSATDSPAYSDGDWSVSDDKLSLVGDSYTGKRLYGSENWGDYIAEADITVNENFNFGMLIRASNPSLGGANNDIFAGTDFLQGYFVFFNENSVMIGKQNYNWNFVAQTPFHAQIGQTYHLKVQAQGATLKVWVDGNLMIEYTDPDPFLWGMVGFRGLVSAASADNLKVYAN